MNDQNTFEIRWFLSVIRKWYWLILICAVLAGLAALFVTARTPPTYAASSTLLIEPSKDSMTSEYSSLIAAERLAVTYSEMLKGRTVLDKVISELNLDTTANKLAQNITAETIRDTQLIRLTVKDESPTRAAEITNQLADTFTAHISAIQSERYANQQEKNQLEIQYLNTQLKTDQAQIDQLQAQSIADENELAQLQTSLVEIRNDARLLQQGYQEAQMTIAQVMDNIKVIQPAPEPGSKPALPYTASVLLLVEQEIASGGVDYSSILASERLTQTYAQLLKSQSVLEESILQLGISQSAKDIQNKISVEPIEDTQLIQLDVLDRDPILATNLANTIAAVFVSQMQASLAEPYTSRLQTIETQLSELAEEQSTTQAEIENLSAAIVQAEIDIESLNKSVAENLRSLQTLEDETERLQQLTDEAAAVVYITEPAAVPTAPTSNRLLYLGLATLVGAAIGLACAFFLEYLDDTIKTTDDVTRLLDVETLGKIGSFSNGNGNLVISEDPFSPVAEAFRVLATNIHFATLDQPIHSLVVTSPSSREGKSVVLANLAVTMARSETSVVAIDGDLRLPNLHELFNLTPGDGLTGALLAGKADGKLQDVKIDGLKVLTCGKLPSNPTEVIGSTRMRELLEKLIAQSNFVLIDSPPVLPVADTTILASIAEGVILVLRAHQTRRQAARDALQRLRQADARIIGVVLNAIPAHAEGYYGYYYHKKEKTRWWQRVPKLRPGKGADSLKPQKDNR